jgi:hypothetical protein
VNPPRSYECTARLLTNTLNPFYIFTSLYALIAFSEASTTRAIIYLIAELAAAAFMAGYVFLLQRRSRVEDFWISARHQRLIPALVLLGAFAVLLGILTLLRAPEDLFLATLSMGLASATVASVTLLWKASAHSTVAGHAGVAGFFILGPLGLVFTLILPIVLWARVAPGAHTLAQALIGAGIGAAFAFAFLA